MSYYYRYTLGRQLRIERCSCAVGLLDTSTLISLYEEMHEVEHGDMRGCLFCGVLLVVAVSRVFASDPVVELVLRGKTLTLSADSSRELAAQAVELVKTSNFHDTLERAWRGDSRESVRGRYQKIMTGDRLIVAMPERKIATIGGDRRMIAIVIGLGREDRAEWLLTLDGDGIPFVHSMYSGVACLKLLETIKRLAAEPLNGAGG